MQKKALVLTTFFILPVMAADFSPEVTVLKKGMPQDVALLIDRIVECNHWNGEEPTNKQRAEQINKAIERLHCDVIDSDQEKMIKQYSNNYEVKNRIQNAKNIF